MLIGSPIIHSTITLKQNAYHHCAHCAIADLAYKPAPATPTNVIPTIIFSVNRGTSKPEFPPVFEALYCYINRPVVVRSLAVLLQTVVCPEWR